MKPAVVFCMDVANAAQAQLLGDELKLPVIEAYGLAGESAKVRLRFFQSHLAALPAMALLVDADALQLARIEASGAVAIRARFHGAGQDYRRAKGGGRAEMIAKAVGLKGQNAPSVVDATAGLGVDAFVLASLGCRVTLLERVPAVNALLQDGLERSRRYASGNDRELEQILARMQVVRIDATEYLNRLSEADCPDVVYLDPMFPERRKSAAVKKEMQLFHQLIGPDQDADQLFEKALSRAVERVVVKRPRIAPALTDREPSYVIQGKRNRFDIYLKRSHSP